MSERGKEKGKIKSLLGSLKMSRMPALVNSGAARLYLLDSGAAFTIPVLLLLLLVSLMLIFIYFDIILMTRDKQYYSNAINFLYSTKCLTGGIKANNMNKTKEKLLKRKKSSYKFKRFKKVKAQSKN